MSVAVLLVPGFMTDSALWDDCLRAFDGFVPLLHVDTSRDDNLGAMADRALAEAPEEFVLVGFSFGGYVAREIARRAPDRVKALVLIATSARAVEPKPVAAGRDRPDSWFTGLTRRTIETSLHSDHRDDATIERIRQMSARVGGAVFRRLSGMRRPCDLDKLAAITCPTLVVAARDDRLRGEDEARELYEGIPGAEIAFVEHSGHMIPIEAPDALTAIIADWLKAHRPAE